MPTHTRSTSIPAILACTLALLSACAAAASNAFAQAPINRPVPVIGLACEGCEALFDGMPAQLTSRLQLAPAGEPGAPMQVIGRVLDRSGQPRAGVVVYAYQTDSHGIYPRPAQRLGREAMRHGRLRGWVQSDAQGRYVIDTIRPGSYPGEDIAEHIHMHILEPGCFTYFIDDLMFLDDPKLGVQERQQAHGTGGNGLLMPVKVGGRWLVERDIVLGQAVPGYRRCNGS